MTERRRLGLRRRRQRLPDRGHGLPLRDRGRARPVGVAITPNGKHLYVTNRISNDVSAYDIVFNEALTASAAPCHAGV